MEGGEGGQSRRVVERDVYNTQYTSKATTVRSFLSSFRNAFDTVRSLKNLLLANWKFSLVYKYGTHDE